MNTRSQPTGPGRLIAGMALALFGAAATTAPTADSLATPPHESIVWCCS
jgi:hypothetical protein